MSNLKRRRSHPYFVKPFRELVEARPDVQDGTLDQSAYAANLGDVVSHIDKPAARAYRDPKLFEEMTYKTDSMNRLLDEVRARLQEGRGNGVRQIETGFGGGKTHTMITMYHECREWGATPIVIDGQSIHVSKTLWGEMERQLDGHTTKMAGQVAPSGEQIHELLRDRTKPTLILIDEIFNYISGAAGIEVGNSDLAAQTIVFMQRLAGQLGSLPKTCLVMSLSDKDDVLNTDTKTAKRHLEYYAKLQNVVGRQRQLDAVSEYGDVSHIVRRRLFKTKEDIISYAAKDIIEYCIKQMTAGGSLTTDEAADYKKRFEDTYPFTPDVIDVLHNRWGSYADFQRTRGVLRLLSLVVHSLLGSDRSWISPGDIDLSVPAIRQELLKYTGDNAGAVLTTDIAGPNALAKDVGVRCASSIFMYSFPSTVKSGATEAEVKRATFSHDMSHAVVGDTIRGLLASLFYLVETESKMLRFDLKPNINQMIDQAKRNASDSAVIEEERKRLEEAMGGGRFVNIIRWPDENHAHNIPDKPVLQLIICKHNNAEWCASMVNGTQKSRRINMNGLIFLLPADGIRLGELLREHLGILDVQQRLFGTPECTKKILDYLKSEVERTKHGICDELLKKYSVVYMAKDGGGVRKIREYTFKYDTDTGKPLDHLIWKRLVNDDCITDRVLASDIAKQYGDDADTAYDTMLRTPGEVLPASLEVVRRSFEPSQPYVPGPRPEPKPHRPDENTTDGEIKPLEPEVMHDSLTYGDVVESSGLDDMRSLFLEAKHLELTAFDCAVKLRPDGKYDIHVEMKGRIPDRLVSSFSPDQAVYDDGWDE